jgi:DNA-binding IclR family transcriptional regulator
MASHEENRRIKSLERTLELVEELRDSGGLGVSALAERVDMSVGTVYTHLATMRDREYVIKVDGEYRLGPQFLAVGEAMRNNTPVYRCGKEEIDALAEETGEYAHLIIVSNGKLLPLYESYGDNAVGIDYHRRKRERWANHLHCSAAGKAYLAGLSEARARDLLDEYGFVRETENTITDTGVLLDELADVRKRGFAFNDEEQIQGIRAVGAPIFDGDGNVLGAVSVSAPKGRMGFERFEEEIPDQVLSTANIIEVNLQTVTAEF